MPISRPSLSTLQDSANRVGGAPPQEPPEGLRPSTTGLELRSGPELLRAAVELLSSMRFAISALTVVAIASAIGTIVPQNSPPINYVNQFGAFWAEVFSAFGLFHVYNAGWFILVMALMLISTSLCLIRNTPKMLKDARAWRERVRINSFAAFAHRAERDLPSGTNAQQMLLQTSQMLEARGYRVRLPDAEGLPMVAKKGTSNRLGYIAAHLSIVVISLGGLMDSELPTRLAAWWWEKEPVQLAGLTGDTVPASAKLPEATPTYRANLLIPEGQSSDLAVLSRPNGALLLDLPFELTLKAFRVEYYATGMPKLFASDVVLKDKETGATKEATIEVNKPLIHRGVAIYQSSFDDGGSQLKLSLHPLQGPLTRALPLELAVGQSQPLSSGQERLTLEISSFKPINVENLGGPRAQDDRFQDHVASVLSPATGSGDRKMTNVGPAFQYKLRDASGQAREFHTYMLPFELDGARVFLAGVRNSPDESFQYLRIPADEQDSLTEFLRIRAALADPLLRARAAQGFARASAPAELRPALSNSAQRALDALAEGGLGALANVIESAVPEADREKAADVIVRMLSGAFWELWQQARLQDQQPRLEPNEARQQFAQRALNAYSDSLLFAAPFLVTMTDFQEIKASVFQVTRSPGQTIVYIGCLLLTLGVFAMFYVRESRVWVWHASSQEGQRLLMAASSPRQSLDFDRDFQDLNKAFQSMPQESK
ncbi:ResB ResB protein required for cytochrome c biosynthesis [Burkholderiales bacterium]